MTYDPAARRDTPLALKLKERISRSGPIPLDQFVAACLSDPEHGYYVREAAIGRAGDFVTAPEISQVFGELIGLWAGVVWQQMGAPEKVNLVELGPGRGTLMTDALRATRLVPGFHEAVEVHLVETSRTLEGEQRLRLAGANVPVQWHRAVQSLPRGAAIVIANEFLDTCPVAQFVVGDGVTQVRGVGLDGCGTLVFTVMPGSDGQKPIADTSDVRLSRGTIVERQDFSVLADLCRALGDAPQAMLFIDYGHGESLAGDSLQAVRRHASEHPLTSPGEADLTVQVDFSAVARLAAAADQGPATRHRVVDGPVTQAEFLGRLGIVERASHLMSANPGKAHEIEAAIARLIAPGGMGTRFKVLGVRSRELPRLPGL